MNNGISATDAADLLFGSFIRYDRMYEMTKFAFYGKTDSNEVNIYIDIYSILKTLYSRGPALQIKDSYVIASCIINLAIHLRAYFETRHNVTSKVYIIYGGARPKEAFVNYYKYNEKNILAEDSDFIIKSLIIDNLDVVKLLCPYLYDIFCIVDMENEFSTIASAIIDGQPKEIPNIVYSKEPLAYQLVAFKPKTFLYRPKKRLNEDLSWVVTKSNLYNSYRYGELKLKQEVDIPLDIKLISIYQSLSGLRSRSMNSLKNANVSLKMLSKAVESNTFPNGYNSNSIFYFKPNPFELLCEQNGLNAAELTNRFAAIDLPYQSMVYKTRPSFTEANIGIINLYDPQSVRNINDKYFTKYPLDLNRV